MPLNALACKSTVPGTLNAFITGGALPLRAFGLLRSGWDLRHVSEHGLPSHRDFQCNTLGEVWKRRSVAGWLLARFAQPELKTA